MRLTPGDMLRRTWNSKEFRRRFRRSLRPRSLLSDGRRVFIFGGGAYADQAEHAAKYADIYAEMDRKIQEGPDLPWADGPADIRWRRVDGRWQRWSQLDRDWADADNPPAGLLAHVQASGDADGPWQLIAGIWQGAE